MTKAKKAAAGAAAVLAVGASIFFLASGHARFRASFKAAQAQNSLEYRAKLSASETFMNTPESALPQPALYPVLWEHMTAPRTDGKTPKLLFIGYDGALALGIDTSVRTFERSASKRLAESGGIWLGYCGGEAVGDQPTGTAAGWSALLTGEWADENGVYNNYPLQGRSRLKKNVHTIMYTLAQKGFRTSFSATWRFFFTSVWRPEIKEAEKIGLPAVYNNAITGTEDSATVGVVIDRIKAGDDAIFCTLEYPDHSGHGGVYSMDDAAYTDAIRACENDAWQMIDTVQARATFAQEDWLIIITSDHGGYTNDHLFGTDSVRFTFFVANKPIF
ncbi:MAG: alkaline phosphatase family protein [Oscillospiraceae bacterium]|nr:alkaline phosphatase family protein [Oscillospiraceae bacterium]